MEFPDDAVARIISSKADLRLLDMVHQRLSELRHSFSCLTAEKRYKKFGRYNCTSIGHCTATKEVLKHMMSCKIIQNCTVPHCSSSRQIFEHWRNCKKPHKACLICRLPRRGQRVEPKAWQSFMTIEERNHLTELL